MEDKSHVCLILLFHGDICRKGETGKKTVDSVHSESRSYHNHANLLDFKMTLGAVIPSAHLC